MKSFIVIACLLCAVAAVPVPDPAPATNIDLLRVPLKDNKELDIITLADEHGSMNERNKRTIGILRQMFPTLSQIMDQKIQMITSVLFRTIGPLLLRGGLGGGTSSTSSSSFDDDDDDDDSNNQTKKAGTSRNGSRVRVSLPTFPPDTDDDDDDDADNSVSQRSSLPTSSVSTTSSAAPTEPTRIDLLASNSLSEKSGRELSLDFASDLPKDGEASTIK